MQTPVNDHWSDEELERYSLGILELPKSASLEEHLLICDQCTRQLASFEPYNFVHYTKEGPFYSRVTKRRTGIFFARHWGRNVVGGKEFRTFRGAKSYLRQSFSQMFPEHVCTARCGSTRPRNA